MTYIIGKGCVDILDGSCVDVCPVDCIYSKPGDNQLFIHPDECIDCGVCEPECPIDAIHADTENDMEKWVEINRTYAEKWPNIAEKKAPPEDSEDWKDIKNKFEKHFSDKPGK